MHIHLRYFIYMIPNVLTYMKAKYVFKFDLALPNGLKHEDLDMSEKYGITVHRKYPLLVTANPRTRKRVDARKWSFLLPILHYWRSQEGAPNARELGESSSNAASRILLVTGEPIHHTIPLLAVRLVRHEDRLDAIANIINNFPREHVEVLAGEVDKLVISQLAMETMIEEMGTQFGEAMEFIGLLCTASTTSKTIMGTMHGP
ncbi:cytochrome P450 [Artemisia annua]|uniref:Cytochrome P450 n=1 Tax=Artemisia annua TaxID=35608 RepID=A0A2U1L5D2_ARTAN|nr:cytochrome P450 [Artemisia annua]